MKFALGTIVLTFIGFIAGRIYQILSEQKYGYLNVYKRGDLYYSKTLWETKREAEFESSGEPDYVRTMKIKL